MAGAQTLVVDRGLPIENVNGEVTRSNVLWADTVAQPGSPAMAGDDFTMPNDGDYVVTKIRVWARANTGLVLWGGKLGQPKVQVSSNFTSTATTYEGGLNYAGSSDPNIQLYQIDFTVNLPLAGGSTYEFFLSGPATVSGGNNTGVHLHASNAGLGGTAQQGADNTFKFLDAGTVLTWNSAGGGTYCGGCVGWFANSDANVQVFASPVPPPIPTMTEWAMILFATLLVGGAALYIQRRRLTA